MKSHGHSTAFSTAPRGAVPHLSFMTEAKTRNMTKMVTVTKSPSTSKLRIPVTTLNKSVAKATQKYAATQVVMDVLTLILSSTDKKNKLVQMYEHMSHLTEPGIRNLFIQNLNECKQIKLNYYTKVLNFSLLVGFVASLGILLYFRRKGRMTQVEKSAKQERDRLYILNQIKMVQIDRQKVNNHLITNLPTPDSPYFFH
jgi:hypothetical protein